MGPDDCPYFSHMGQSSEGAPVWDEEMFLDPKTGCLPLQNHIFGPDFFRSYYELTGNDKPRNAIVPGLGRFPFPKFAEMTCWYCGKTYAQVVAENPGVTFVLNDPHPEFDNVRFYELKLPER